MKFQILRTTLPALGIVGIWLFTLHPFHVAQAAEQPHAVIVVGTHHYSPHQSMPPFAAELERLGMRTTVINPDWDPEKDPRGLPGLEALAEADVALFFTRFLKLEDDQLAHITRYLESGRPVVGLRTSTHAFKYPKGHPLEGLNTSFGRDNLGTPYLIHLAGRTQIHRVAGAERHPILTGVDAESWESPGTLYLTKLESGCTPLLSGTGDSKRTGQVTNQFGTHELAKTMTDTVAWTWTNKWGGRTFTTSLGHAGDFAVPQSMRVLVNGVFWAAGLAVPSATTEIRTVPGGRTETAPAKKPRRKQAEREQPEKDAPATGGITLFYGNSMVERLQEEGTLEALLQAAQAGQHRQYRSLAYTGDEVGFRIRPEKFGDHLAYIAGQLPADRVVLCFGMNEAFAGSLETEKFIKDLETYLTVIKDRHPNAELILVSPTAVEDSDAGSFPDATERNDVIADYCQNIRYVAAKNGIAHVDLFTPSRQLFADSRTRLTMNGLHLNDAGNRAIAKVLASALTSAEKVAAVKTVSPGFEALRQLVARKAYEVAMAYKPANGIHYYGVRSRSFEYESEIPHHLRLANLLDAAIWAQAADLSRARPFPELPTAVAEPPTKQPRKGLGVIKTAAEDLKDFTVAEGFEVNAFASSEDFPELINPLQINFDARGRLWVACFASYPVPVPGTLSHDKILIFEDTDGDGRADRRTVFADDLKLPDGFVFYRDGIIASVARQLVWLRDTDGDDVADVREELLRGADDTDTHHGGYLARTPQGHVVYCEGLFHRGQFETPWGPVRTKDATALYLDPVTRQLTIQRQTTHPNPWKISYNQWGESMQMFGGGQIIDCDYYDVWTPVGTSSSGGMGMPFRDDKGCTLAWVSSPHFPKEWQGGLVTGHLLSKNAVLFTPLKLEGGTYVGADKPRNLLSSPNKVFRPTDLAFGLDGALYVADFYYPIIGHAQHSIRDENRDYANGRIWRVTHKGAPLAKAPVIDRAPLNELFDLLTHEQVRVRELARLELEKNAPDKVLRLARSQAGTEDERLALELMWLFERNRDFSQTNLFRRLVKSETVEIRRAAARSLRWWAPALGREAHAIAAGLAKSGDERTRIAVVSVASHLQVADKSWRDLIHQVDAAPDSPLAKVASLAALYDTPPLKPQFPLLKVDPAASLTGWLMNDSGRGGSLIVTSERQQELVLGYRANAFMNLNLNNIPLQRATGSLHTRNGQLNVTLQPGVNKIEYYIAVDGRGRAGQADLYLADLIGGRPDGLTFPEDETAHRALTEAYDAENATVTGDRIRLKAVPAKMAFNATRITVQAGRRYTISFENPDHMLHNLVITRPGKASVVGELVDAMTTQPDAMARHFIPETDLILFATPQIPHGERFEQEFTTPDEPGRYPFLCTFPGHWRLMAGVMIVEDAKPTRPPVRKVASRKPSRLTTPTSSDGVIIESAASPNDFKTLNPMATRSAKVTTNRRTSNDPVSVLTDGELNQRFGPVFANGITDGAYKLDLGSVTPVRAITSWSHNQAGKRGTQRLKLYGSDSDKDPGWDLSKFTVLGSIETGPAKATFTAASLRAGDGKTLGEFRWIVWSVQPVTGLNENTAFQELGVETVQNSTKPAPPEHRNQTRRAPAAKPQGDETKARPTRTSPNIILVMTDDQGWGEVGFHGNNTLKTPNLDRFAAEGTELLNFYVSPMCTPTRSSLMTGRYHFRTGAHDTFIGRSNMRPQETTIAEVFAEAGYRTGIFGKWHLGENYPMRAQDQGFQKVVVHGGGGIGQFADHPGNRYWNPTLLYNDEFRQAEGYCTDVFIDESIRFMAENRDQPFFCYLPLNIPHAPFDVDQEFFQPYEDQGVKDEGKRQWTTKIYGMITQFDGAFQRLLDAVDEMGLRENTIIIFMSDNGPNSTYFTAGLRDKKGSVYENGFRSPFVIQWPKAMQSGRKLNDPAMHIDLLPTLAEAAGIKLPASLNIDGQSILPLLTGKVKQLPERYLFMQHNRANIPDRYRNFMVRKGPYKVVQGVGSGFTPVPANPTYELFNIHRDPGERDNLAAQHPDMVKDFVGEYEKWFTDVTAELRENDGAPFPYELNPIQRQPYRFTWQCWFGPDAHWRSTAYGRWTMNNPGLSKRFDVTILPQRQHHGKPGKLKFIWQGRTIEKTFEEVPAAIALENIELAEGSGFMEAQLHLGGRKWGVKEVQIRLRTP